MDRGLRGPCGRDSLVGLLLPLDSTGNLVKSNRNGSELYSITLLGKYYAKR